jgi:hypothetical protein
MEGAGGRKRQVEEAAGGVDNAMLKDLNSKNGDAS